jgi:hypothetical protein
MRSTKPEFWADQDLARLSRDVRLLYMALWNHCDEQARMQGDPRLVKSWCFPLDDDVTVAVIDAWLTDLEKASKVIRYDVDGSQYIHLPRLEDHQKLDPRLPSRLPPPPVGVPTPPRPDQSVSMLSDPSSPADMGTPDDNTDSPQPVGVQHQPEGAKHVAGGMKHVAGSRGQVASTPTSRRGTRLDPDWTPPPDVIDAMRAEGIPDETARRELPRFRDYWAAKAGKDAVKIDWNATWRNWLRRAGDDTSRASPGAASTKAAGWLAIAQGGTP